MRDPFKNGEIVDDDGAGSCLSQAVSMVAVVLLALRACGVATWYGLTGFMERI